MGEGAFKMTQWCQRHGSDHIWQVVGERQRLRGCFALKCRQSKAARAPMMLKPIVSSMPSLAGALCSKKGRSHDGRRHALVPDRASPCKEGSARVTSRRNTLQGNCCRCIMPLWNGILYVFEHACGPPKIVVVGQDVAWMGLSIT